MPLSSCIAGLKAPRRSERRTPRGRHVLDVEPFGPASTSAKRPSPQLYDAPPRRRPLSPNTLARRSSREMVTSRPGPASRSIPHQRDSPQLRNGGTGWSGSREPARAGRSSRRRANCAPRGCRRASNARGSPPERVQPWTASPCCARVDGRSPPRTPPPSASPRRKCRPAMSRPTPTHGVCGTDSSGAAPDQATDRSAPITDGTLIALAAGPQGWGAGTAAKRRNDGEPPARPGRCRVVAARLLLLYQLPLGTRSAPGWRPWPAERRRANR